MKKLVVMVAGLLLTASPALALITGSSHDIPFKYPAAGNTNEICVYCHTPHAAVGVPLWNRTSSGSMAGGVYTSGTLNATMPADYTATDGALCMSCHDGTSAMNAISNFPNSGLALSANTIAGPANLGDGTWTNDHPIGFSYASAISNGDTELVAKTSTKLVGGLPLFTQGAVDDAVWCSSCHDVHNSGAAGAGNLLLKSNAGSNLCLSCHAK